MSFYPSLEDLEVDQLAHAQTNAARAVAAISSAEAARASAAGAPVAETRSLYYGLGLEEFLCDDFMGLDVSQQAIVAQMPQEVALVLSPGTVSALPGQHAIASITPKGDVNMRRAEIKQGVREVILAKDGSGKLGLAVKSIDKGIFVSFVWQGSAAAMAGVRFCDQILQIEGENVAGWTEKQALKKLHDARPDRVVLAIRERPWCRTVTAIKDSLNHIGFTFRDGEINNIVKDSSAARNGLLIHHRLVEINGQNVVGMTDEQIQGVIKAAPRSVTLTIMPSFIYKHLIKKVGSSLIRKYMDHSVPEI